MNDGACSYVPETDISTSRLLHLDLIVDVFEAQYVEKGKMAIVVSRVFYNLLIIHSLCSISC